MMDDRKQKLSVWYDVPLEHNQIVRDGDRLGRVTTISGNYILVRWAGKKMSTRHHPHSIDYQLPDGSWLLGAELSKRLNAHIDEINRKLNGL